jgi:hypothetical protein
MDEQDGQPRESLNKRLAALSPIPEDPGSPKHDVPVSTHFLQYSYPTWFN